MEETELTIKLLVLNLSVDCDTDTSNSSNCLNHQQIYNQDINTFQIMWSPSGTIFQIIYVVSVAILMILRI